MKAKLLLLLVAVIAVQVAGARNTEPKEPLDKSVACNPKKKNDVNGKVTQSDNKRPLKNVSVTAYPVDRKEATVIQTNDNGHYVFDELKPGVYKFVFEKSGYKKIVRDKITIRTDEGFQLDIEMTENRVIEVAPSPLHFSDF
jgi:glucose/arabinose dehydrogenase